MLFRWKYLEKAGQLRQTWNTTGTKRTIDNHSCMAWKVRDQMWKNRKTPEMVEKLSAEVIAEDEWAALIKQLEIPKLVEQLALNSYCERSGRDFTLTLRANQIHLNNDKVLSELKTAISGVVGEPITLSIQTGDAGITPLERRERRYQEKLATAVQCLTSDPNVQFIQQRFAAELDQDSVRPI